MPTETLNCSEALLAEASQVVPGGVNSARRRVDPSLCIRRASGAYLEDVDGRTFVDYHAAWGAILLGHSHPAVVERVSDAIRETVLFGIGTTEAESALAHKIVQHVPSAEQVLLCNSGSEATYHAVRLARAITGREKLIKFQGCYHGFHDYLLAGAGEGRGAAGGVLQAATERTLVCSFNDLDHVAETLSANQHEVAAVIVEPIAHNATTMVPKPGFLEGLRTLCDNHAAVLIFDEVITGFRHHLGGYQAIVGVTPDLTTMGKSIANGFPLAVIAGRRELMERFSTKPGGDVLFGGTFNGGAVGVHAALSTIEFLEQNDVHEHIFRLGERMRAGLREIAIGVGVPATVAGFGSVFVLCFMEGPIQSYADVLRNDADMFVRYRRELIARGVFEWPDSVGCRSHVSFSHTEEDVDRTLDIAVEALHSAVTKAPAASSP